MNYCYLYPILSNQEIQESFIKIICLFIIISKIEKMPEIAELLEPHLDYHYRGHKGESKQVYVE